MLNKRISFLSVVLCCLTGMTKKTGSNSIQIHPTFLIFGRKRCCKRQKTRGRRNAGRRCVCVCVCGQKHALYTVSTLTQS